MSWRCYFAAARPPRWLAAGCAGRGPSNGRRSLSVRKDLRARRDHCRGDPVAGQGLGDLLRVLQVRRDPSGARLIRRTDGEVHANPRVQQPPVM